MKIKNVTRVNRRNSNYSQVLNQDAPYSRPLPKQDSPYKIKTKISDPSVSVNDINIPEVKEQNAEFVYNFYTRDERINPFSNVKNLPLTKIPRYVTLSWKSPSLSEFEANKQSYSKTTGDLSIKGNSSKITSEDNFSNFGYVNHTFSNVDAIEQGASDLENYSRVSQFDAESMFKMSKYQIQEISKFGASDDESFKKNLAEVTSVYTNLADFPKNSMGLRVYDEKGNLNDNDDLISSISDSLSLNVKINSTVVPDIFKESKDKTDKNLLKNLRISYTDALSGKKRDFLSIVPVQNDSSETSKSYLTQPVSIVGYIIDRYLVTSEGMKKENTYYIEDPQQTRFQDTSVLYGKTYVYSVRVVAAVKLLSYKTDGSAVDVSTIYVSSKPVSLPVECYEYVPPPEPENIRFFFDYNRRNLKILWDMPVNPQKDVRQFQVFRRKTIKEPFELIAQYGFDMTKEGPGGSKYKTGEVVDANNISEMNPDYKYLVHTQDSGIDQEYPIYMHVDDDFTVDTEFYASSAYIYSVCSIDAHGMISNYSSQHHVTFDPYKNKIVTSIVCDSGSPRQYPNMNLRMDAFKDVISVSGDDSRKLEVYFTPEYLKVKDERNVTYNIVEGQSNSKNSYYVLQLINLDNQKTQLLRINIKDPQGLTV